MDPVEKLWRIRRTVLEMLRDRGHRVDDAAFLTRSDFGSRVNAVMAEGRGDDFTIVTQDEVNKDRVIVFFPESTKLGKQSFRDLVKKMTNLNLTHCIMVIKGGVSPAVNKLVTTLNVHKYRTELFFDEELVVNITKHKMVPKHVALTKQEKQDILDKYSVTDAQLPRIKQSDVVSRYYGFRRGQLIQITRDSDTAGKYVTYRIVF